VSWISQSLVALAATVTLVARAQSGLLRSYALAIAVSVVVLTIVFVAVR